MELREALYTTRAMRRVSDEPVPEEAVARILDATIRAPSGSNSQNWRILVVTDPRVRKQLGPLYREAYEILNETVYAGKRQAAEDAGAGPILRVMRSSDWLAENFEVVPLWLMFFSRNDSTGSSIYPAVWSAMLAARGEGIGTCLTTILGLFRGVEAFEVLGVPGDKGWKMAAAVSCGYPLGRWGLAERKPVEEVAFANGWGKALDLKVNGPLWS